MHIILVNRVHVFITHLSKGWLQLAKVSVELVADVQEPEEKAETTKGCKDVGNSGRY